MTVAEWSGSRLAWQRELADVKDRLSAVFRRRELKGTGAAFLDGLLTGIGSSADHDGTLLPVRHRADASGIDFIDRAIRLPGPDQDSGLASYAILLHTNP